MAWNVSVITQGDGTIDLGNYETESEARSKVRAIADKGVWLSSTERIAWHRIDVVDVTEV